MLRKSSSLAHLALVLAFGTIALPSGLMRPAAVQAVDPAASSVGAAASPVRIDGSGSMAAINTALQQTLSQKNPAIPVTTASNGTAAGLAALRQGQVDLAAIGRDLTDAERAEGFVAIPIQREKVAMLVGTANPYSGSMTIGQFAAMFRGEVTDWAKVGGAAVPVRFIDQPEASDTRIALSNYPAFKAAPFVNGPTTTRVADETAQSIASALGADGIGYVVVSQAQNLPGTRIVTMHQTLPDDPRYPFSQSSAYVYRKGQLTPAAQAFLTNLTQPEAIAALQGAAASDAQVLLPNNPALTAALAETPVAAAVAIAPTVTAPTVTAPVATAPVATAPVATAPSGGLPWWLLLVPIGAGLAWWALKSRGGAAPIAAAPPAMPPVTPPPVTPLSVVPAVTPVPPVVPVSEGIAPFKPQVEVAAPIGQPIGEPPVVSAEPPVVTTEATGQLNFLGLGTTMVGGVALGAAAIGRSADRADADAVVPGQLDLPLTEAAPVTTDFAPINQLPAPDQPPVTTGRLETIAAGVEPPIVAPAVDATPIVAPPAPPMPIATATGSLDATMAGVAAVGLGKTFSVAANMPDERMVVRLDQSNVAATKYDVGQADPEVAASEFGSTDMTARALADVDETLPDLPGGYGESRMVLMARDPQWAYAYWDVPDEMRQPLRDQGGKQFALRLYDVTDMPLNQQQPHSVQQYEIDELTMNWYLPLPVSDRDYTAELGYLATGGRWLSLVRSNTVRVAPIYPSDWEDDQMVSIGWNEPLQGRHFGQLQTPSAPAADAMHEAMYQRSRPDAGAIAGSLFGSGSGFESISSFAVTGDVGQWALPTTSGQSMSGVGMMGELNASGLNVSGLNAFGADTFGPDTFGLNMSGLNMSGLNMSGAGMLAAAPRARQFWLVADAELIVYGATEPTASLTIGGEPIKLTEDGTFRLSMSFQDGQLRFPIMAVAADGEQMRQVEIRCDRQTPLRRTNTREEAEPEQLD
jgi:ABC-type phosphate transport system substrate-binding protein